jgi:hypothetical protein
MYSPEHRPAIDLQQRSLLAGLVLGHSKIDTQNATPALDLRTRNPSFAVWVHENLGWLANNITKTVRTPPRDDTYIVRSHAHPALNEFVGWEDTIPQIDRAIPTRYALRAWVARSGAAKWDHSAADSPRYTEFHAEGDRKGEIARLMRDLGFDPWVEATSVTLGQDDTHWLFDAIGPSVPGAKHKWQLDQRLYESEQRGQWIERSELQHDMPSEGVLGRYPSAWERTFSERAAIQALRSAASDGQVTRSRYEQWREGRREKVPAFKWYRYGSDVTFSDWAALAGVRTGGASWTDQGSIISVRRAQRAHREDLTREMYVEWRDKQREKHPSPALLYKRFGSWNDVLTAAGLDEISR